MEDFAPILSLKERDRRWKIVREMMKDKRLDCLIVVGLSGRESWEGYLTNDYAGGMVVFPLEGQPTYVVWGSTSVFRSIESARRGETVWIDNWQENWRVGATGRGLVAVLQEKGFEAATIGVVGIDAKNPYQVEGYVSYRTWSHVLEHLPKATFVEVSEDFCKLMLVKSEEELAVVRHSASIGEKACEALLSVIRPGVSESEIAAAIMKEIYSNGASPGARGLILHTGLENLSWGVPSWMFESHRPRRMQEGELVMTEIFVVYGGMETQQQMCASLKPVHPLNLELATISRSAFEVGLKALRPGKRFLEVAQEMEAPIAEAGCWHMMPLIHTLKPVVWIGPTNVGIDKLPGIEEFKAVSKPYLPTDDFVIQPGMVFELEPNATRGRQRVNIGGAVIVTENGVEQLNKISTEMRVV